MEKKEMVMQDVQFILETDELKNIERMTKILGNRRRENDAEHSWHVSLCAMIFKKYAGEAVDVNRVIQMLLVHDIVEVDAGDTYCYDEVGNSEKASKEAKAARRLFSIPSEESGNLMRSLWEEFEEGKTPDAVFANAMDRLQPFLLNFANDGESWIQNRISKEQVTKRLYPISKASPELWTLVLEMLDLSEMRGYFTQR